MTVITLPRPTAPEATATTARYFAAPDAFRVLRAWRAWAARGRDHATTGFSLVRTDEGTLLLASENLGAEAVRAIGLHSRRRLNEVAGAAQPEPDGTPCIVTSLRSLDDWAIEVLLRAGAEVSRSLVVGLRHRDGRFDLVAWLRQDAPQPAVDAHELLSALAPWIER